MYKKDLNTKQNTDYKKLLTPKQGLTEDLIISVKLARKILGKNYRGKGDEEIIKLIEELARLCNLIIEDGILSKID